MAKSIIGWVGSKYNQPLIIDFIRECYQKHDSKIFTSPFAGSLGEILRIEPDKVIANDVNATLIEFFIWFKTSNFNWDCMPENDLETYYQMRNKLNSFLINGYTEEQKNDFYSTFYWINCCCFNRLWRVNNKGLFNVPIGRKGKNKQPKNFVNPIKLIEDFREISKHWVLNVKSWNETLETVHPNQFIYCDPPYSSTYTSYTPGGFSYVDQIRLAETCSKLSNPVLISNANVPIIVRLYERLGFKIKYIGAKRSIDPKNNVRSIKEIVAYKNI